MTFKSSPQPSQVGAKRTYHGGTPQKWKLDDRGRRLIAECYDGTSRCVDELQRQLGVPRYIIREWAKELGVGRNSPCPRWLPDEVAYLESHINTTAVNAIAEHLGRSENSVRIKARKMGLDVHDGYSLKDIWEGLGCSHTTAVKWVKEGKLKGTRRAFDEGTWHFTDAQIRDFVRSHPMEIDLRRVDQLWFLDVCLGGLGNLDSPD